MIELNINLKRKKKKQLKKLEMKIKKISEKLFLKLIISYRTTKKNLRNFCN